MSIKKQQKKSFKDSKGKPPVELIPWAAEEAMADAFAFGATKYGRHNYKIDGLPVTLLLGAAKRHIGKFLDGIDLDDEIGSKDLADSEIKIKTGRATSTTNLLAPPRSGLTRRLYRKPTAANLQLGTATRQKVKL